MTPAVDDEDVSWLRTRGRASWICRAWPVGVRTLVVSSVHQVSTRLLTLSSSLSSPCCPFSPSLSFFSFPSFLSLGSLPFFLFLRSPLVSFQFSFVRYARSVHLLYDGRTCILRGPPQKEVALKGKARLIR